MRYIFLTILFIFSLATISVSAQIPTDLENRLVEATLFFQNREFEKAIPAFEIVLSEIPLTETKIRYMVEGFLSQCYIAAEQYYDALSILEKLDRQPNSDIIPKSDLKVDLLNVYASLHLVEEVAITEKFLTENLTSYDLRTQRHVIDALVHYYMEFGQDTKTIKYAEKSLSITYPIESEIERASFDVQNNSLYMALSSAYDNIGEFEKALSYTLKGLESVNEYTEHTTPVLLERVAICCSKLERHQDALTYQSQVFDFLAKHPEIVPDKDFLYKIYVELGDIFINLHRIQDAITAFQNALVYCHEKTENLYYCYAKLYYCYENTGNIDGKRKFEEPILRYVKEKSIKDEESLIVFSRFAEIQKNTGKLEDALALYENIYRSAVEIFGSNSRKILSYSINYVSALLLTHRYAYAQELIDTILTFAATDATAERLMAQILQTELLVVNGKVGEAIDHLLSMEEVINSVNNAYVMDMYYR